MRKTVLTLAVVAASLVPGAARAVVTPGSSLILAGPGATLTTYAGVVFVEAGTGVEFVNLDIDQHDVLSYGTRPPDDPAPFCANYPSGNCPLFRTDLIGLAQVDPVEGVEDLPTGVYDFFCSFHDWMQATLVVV